MLLRKASAAAQSFASNPRLAAEPFPLGLAGRAIRFLLQLFVERPNLLDFINIHETAGDYRQGNS